MTLPVRGDLPLAALSRRLRRPAGRPRTLLAAAPAGNGIQSAVPEPAPDAAPRAVFATSWPPRWLPMAAAAAYSGVPVRTLWRLVKAKTLRAVRVPGCRRVLLDRLDLDALLEEHKA